MKAAAEIITLHKFAGNLKKWNLKFPTDPRDEAVFNSVYKKLTALINSLSKTSQSELNELRQNIRWQLNRAVFSIYLKTAPRYFQDINGRQVVDKLSYAWCMDYYGIDPVLKKLAQLIRNQNILDPFAGSGTDMHLVAAFCQPHSITCSDFSYAGGQYVPGTRAFYFPEKNRDEIDKIYRGLPLWYQPRLSLIMKQYKYSDAKELPYKNKAFDWVVSYPPFGIKYRLGGVDYLLKYLPELLRVSSRGVFFPALLTWKNSIKQKYPYCRDLTGDTTKGKSKYPLCFILIRR